MNTNIPLPPPVPETMEYQYDERRHYDVTKHILHLHWATQKFYVVHYLSLREDAEKMAADRAEHLRSKLASLN